MLLLAPPSLTVTVMIDAPRPKATGAKVMEPVAFGLVYVTVGFGIRPVLLEVAVTVKVWFSFVAPEEIPERGTVWVPAFSGMVTLVSAFNVGVWFTEFTVTMNVRVTML